ncbi:MAG: RES family NAD+ phosphorylase [Opitutaceae bacterium]|nr:RES family NAD+ phosphorylase [Opitutaceae bacterium]
MAPILKPNPRYAEFHETLATHPQWLKPWTGTLFRFQTINFPTARDIISGAGARMRGGRWNPPGLAAVYGSTSDSIALEECRAHDRYYGVVTKGPRVLVAIEVRLTKVLDLRLPSLRRALHITQRELASEDWRKLMQTRQESQTQALGRAAAAIGASGMLVNSANARSGTNGVVFPSAHPDDCIEVVEGEKLARFSLKPKS